MKPSLQHTGSLGLSSAAVHSALINLPRSVLTDLPHGPLLLLSSSHVQVPADLPRGMSSATTWNSADLSCGTLLFFKIIAVQNIISYCSVHLVELNTKFSDLINLKLVAPSESIEWMML